MLLFSTGCEGSTKPLALLRLLMPASNRELDSMPGMKSNSRMLDRLTGDDAALKSGMAAAKADIEVAQMIHAARTGAGLSQRELAERIGTRQPVIARLETAEYQGHSLTMLRRIASALNQRLEVRFVPRKPSSIRPLR